MGRWSSWSERRQGIPQELAFAAAGIGDLVNVDDVADDDPLRCPECGWIWPDEQSRCDGCGYPDPIEAED
jgi:hypothetical protein